MGGYENKWIATSDPSGFDKVKCIFSKWCPPRENKGEWGDPPDHPPGPCWQDDYGRSRPYAYSTYLTSVAPKRNCPWAKGHHYAPETSNLVIDSTLNSHWCYDANVSRTGSGILEYLNEVINSEDEALQIFHIIVNTHDHKGGSISLDLAFPLNSCNPSLSRFADGTLFVREYRKGKRRGTGIFHWRDPDVCNKCWESDNLSMRVGDEPNGSLREDSNGRRGLSMPIRKEDIVEAERNNEDWIIYDFLVKWASGGKVRIAFPTKTLNDVIRHSWNPSPIFTTSFDW